MIAHLSDPDANAIAAALGAVGLCVTGYFSYKAAKRVKTGNGHTAGETLDSLRDDIALIKLWLIEHIRDHEEQH